MNYCKIALVPLFPCENYSKRCELWWNTYFLNRHCILVMKMTIQSGFLLVWSLSPISGTCFARFTGIEKQELISPKDKIRYLISIAKNGFTNSAIFSVCKDELQNTAKGNSDIWKKGTTELAKKPFRVGV